MPGKSYIKSTVEGCILVNDINCFSKKSGVKSTSSRFDDLGVPAGYLSKKNTNQCKILKDESDVEPISEKKFNYFINKMLP